MTTLQIYQLSASLIVYAQLMVNEVYGIYKRVSCLDYPLDVLISWSQRLSLYNWFFLHVHFTY